MKIKSRFVLKRGVLFDLEISYFGWKRGVFLAQNPRKGGIFLSFATSVVYVLVGGGGWDQSTSSRYNDLCIPRYFGSMFEMLQIILNGTPKHSHFTTISHITNAVGI